MPARPRTAARRPRSSLLAASAAAMPIHNTKKSAERLSAGRKRSSTGELSPERRRSASPVTDQLARFALAAIDGAFVAWQADREATLGQLLQPLAPSLVASRRALLAKAD